MEYLDFRLPAGGFANPLQLWLACHRRLEGVCTLLRRLTHHLAEFGNDDASRLSAEGIRRYFNVAVPRHYDDEDVDLFPSLLEQLRGRRRAAVRTLFEQMSEEHRHSDALWQPLDGQLAAVQRGSSTLPDAQRVGTFVEALLRHRSAEESSLLRTLEESLSAAALARIGEAMAVRRGATWAQFAAGAL